RSEHNEGGPMEGYDVVTVDEHKIGKVVGESGEYLIVEQGLLRKTQHPLPREFAHVDDDEQQVRVTVPKEILADSPKLDEYFDERAVKEHYGLGDRRPEMLEDRPSGIDERDQDGR